MPAYYRPRCMVRLRVPVMGTVSERIQQSKERTIVEFNLPAYRVRITNNDFNQADECTVEVTYDKIGADPRLLSNAIMYVYIGNATSQDKWQPTDADLRFVGIVCSAERGLSDEKKTISLKALDYTTLFIAMKPYPQATGIPKFSQTIREAWATVCDHTGFYDFSTGSGQIISSVADLRTRIKGIPDDSVLDSVLGKAVLGRIAAFGVMQVPHESDAWAVWRVCCDSLGLLTWIYTDTCYVAQAPDYYSAQDPALFVYGINIKNMTETRDIATLNGKGMHLTSFDPVTGKTLESFFPLRNDPRVVKRRLPAGTSSNSKKTQVPGLAPVTDYEHQVYPYACTQETLDDACNRVWEERSRQELEGKFETAEMTVLSQSGAVVDVLGLKHGDQIVVTLDQNSLDEMRALPTTFARSYYLLQRGFPAATAALIARDQGYLQSLLATFVIKTVEVELDTEGEHFKADISYLSRINPNTGTTDESTTNNTETITQQLPDYYKTYYPI